MRSSGLKHCAVQSGAETLPESMVMQRRRAPAEVKRRRRNSSFRFYSARFV